MNQLLQLLHSDTKCPKMRITKHSFLILAAAHSMFQFLTLIMESSQQKVLMVILTLVAVISTISLLNTLHNALKQRKRLNSMRITKSANVLCSSLKLNARKLSVHFLQ